MSTQHTPGPWQVKPSNNEITNADHGRLPFAIVAGYFLIGATYENGKDARLIAAAPDLLDELKKLRRAYVSLLETGRDRIIQYGGQCDSVEAMEAADPYLKSSSAVIAKATGGA